MADYSWVGRTLHRAVLGSCVVGEALFDFERALHLRATAPVERPVFVTGLARAGTTVITRALHASGQFSSLTYRDMPFVMAPNLWARISRYNPKQVGSRERAHGDGVVVDVDSIEALEEVFWRVFLGGDYIGETQLRKHRVPAGIQRTFDQWQRLVCLRHGRSRYLSKNNNNVLRIESLAAAYPRAVFLVPFRDPLQQAASLLRQHRRFSGSSRFTRAYMKWLVHHEFGDGYRPFYLSDAGPGQGGLDGLEYWLKVWIHVYGSMAAYLESAPVNVFAVSHERLCGEQRAWRQLCGQAGISVDTPHAFQLRERTVDIPVGDRHREIAMEIYKRLDAQCLRGACEVARA